MLYAFHTAIHPLDRDAVAGEPIPIAGQNVRPLAVSSAAMQRPHRVTFDRCVEILATLPRMLLEPDGSFVWTGESDGVAWQVEGVLYDQGSRLAYAEISGRAPPDEFDQLLAALGWPAAPLMFQLMPAGVFIDEAEFRRLCSI